MGLPPPGVKVPDLRLDKNGEWYVDGERILHERTCAVLTENVRLLDDGRFVTAIGREVVPIRADDTAFFVRSASVAHDSLVLLLSDGSEERSSDLRAGDDGRLYVRVKGGRAWARFSRAAHQGLEPLVEERQGCLGLRLGSRFVPVA